MIIIASTNQRFLEGNINNHVIIYNKINKINNKTNLKDNNNSLDS